MNRKKMAGGAAAAGIITCALLAGMSWLHAADQPAAASKEGTAAFRRVVKQVLPAVVSIDATSAPKKAKDDGENGGKRRRPRRALPEGMPEDFREQMERMFGQTDEADTAPRHGFGSGVVISPDGVVLTNNHVVEGADKVRVTLSDGRQFMSSDIKRDPKTDIAIVRIDAKGTALPYAELGDSDALEVGDWVLAMGAPFGAQNRNTVTHGICSGKGRSPIDKDRLMYQDFIQTDAAINPGNSGGPLVDLDGKIVGINTAIESRTGSFAGIGYSVPANLIRNVADQLVKFGKVKRSYLGVSMQDVSADLAERLKLPTHKGVQIVSLPAGESPARKAGLEPADVVIAVDGKPITDGKTLQSVVSAAMPGKTLNFTVVREGKERIIPVTVQEQPEDFGVAATQRASRQAEEDKAESVEVGKLGVTVETRGRNVVITEVAPGSVADQAGLASGMTILEAESQKVGTPEELTKALAKADLANAGILLKIKTRDGAVILLNLKAN